MGLSVRCITTFLTLMLSLPVAAQAPRHGDLSYRQQDCNIIVDYNKHNPYAYLFREYCEQIIAATNQSTARILGRPQPSKKVLKVPAHGTDEAKRLGVACMGGLVMLRIENGWKQALDNDHRYYTCRQP